MAATENKSPVNSKSLEENYSKKTLRKLQSEVCTQLSCSVCPKYRCTSLKMYDEHLKSKKHLRRKFRKESESLWYCEACKLKLPNDAEWVKILKVEVKSVM
ncbi:Hypothetical predicted protein [Paramuricea clavata]|uniref:C2H2-type domain-containing protein n=1 Tax=Paramuricea clavata TaxID=317549 RepID=A0A7D9EIF8_PARCT|nr:Hypothetical predicted protein [Paramuricea clavata]